MTLWVTARDGMIAGLAGGLLLGVGGRVAMRLIAVLGGLPLGFSIGGTVEVMATGWLIGIPAALLFGGLRRFVPGRGLRKGALFGIVVFVVLVVFPPTAARSAATAVGYLPLALGLFAALFVLYGLATEYIFERLQARRER